MIYTVYIDKSETLHLSIQFNFLYLKNGKCCTEETQKLFTMEAKK